LCVFRRSVRGWFRLRLVGGAGAVPVHPPRRRQIARLSGLGLLATT
jgi:hypothetical protein